MGAARPFSRADCAAPSTDSRASAAVNDHGSATCAASTARWAAACMAARSAAFVARLCESARRALTCLPTLCSSVSTLRRRESALSGRNLDCRHVQLQGGHRCFLSVVCHCWQGGLIVVAGEEGSWSWKQETTRKVNNTSQQEETRGRYKNMAAAQQQWHVARGWNIICHSEQQTPLKS